VAPPKTLVNASDAALYFRVVHSVCVQPATIRQWASRKRIGSHGVRRERYDLREIVAYAKTLGVIPGRPTEAQTNRGDVGVHGTTDYGAMGR
jgi:hypothetical protein